MSDGATVGETARRAPMVDETARRAPKQELPLPHPLEWILLCAGLALVIRYRWLFDDAFVYFRYVDHLVFLDAGLVYNRGEYVEGFSSPLHCLLLAALRALHLGFPEIVWGLGVVSFLVFGYGLVVLNRRLSPPGRVLGFPLAYLALNYSVASFFTSGLETPLEHVLAVGVALFVLQPRSIPLAVGVALAPLVRPELALALGMAAVWAWARTRSFPWVLAITAALANGAWLVFRIGYYADLLPNTFYLKDRNELGRGLRYLADAAGPYHLLLVVGVLALLLAMAARRPPVDAPLRVAPRLMMGAIALAVAAYVARIGGAAVHYWYLSFAFPLFVCAFAGIPELSLARFGVRSRPVLQAGAMVGVALLVFAAHPRQLSSHPFFDSPKVRVPDGINDPHWHRRLQLWESSGDVTIAALRAFAPQLAEDGYDGVLVGGWCQDNWEFFRLRVVHSFGLTEAVLARIDALEYRGGHKQLEQLAHEIAALQEGGARGPGMYRAALEAGRAPSWVRPNLDALEVIERKVYNRHAFAENLALALAFPRVRHDPLAPWRSPTRGGRGG